MNFSGQRRFLKVRALRKAFNLHHTEKGSKGKNSEILFLYAPKTVF